MLARGSAHKFPPESQQVSVRVFCFATMLRAEKFSGPYWSVCSALCSHAMNLGGGAGFGVKSLFEKILFTQNYFTQLVFYVKNENSLREQ